MMIAAGLTALLLLLLTGLMAGTSTREEALRARVELQLMGGVCERELTSAIKSTGPVDIDGDGWMDYPYFFRDGAATGVYAFLAHLPAQHAALAGDPDFGPTWEMAFRIAEDAAGVGYPTNSVTGLLEWSADTYAVVLVTATNGVNEVRLRRHDATGTLIEDRSIARHVERLLFQTWNGPDALSADPGLGINQARATVWFRRAETGKDPLRNQVESETNFRTVQP